MAKQTLPETAKSTWAHDAIAYDDDNEWGDDIDKNMENMEAMLSDVEVSCPKGTGGEEETLEEIDPRH
jgi:hypothetical protein